MAYTESGNGRTRGSSRPVACRGGAWGVLLAWMLGAPAIEAAAPPAPRAKPGQFLLVPREGVGDEPLNRWADGQRFETVHRFPALGGVRVIRFGEGRTLDDALRLAEASGLADWVEPDYLLTTYRTPDDPQFLAGTQWALSNPGGSGGTAGADLGAPRAWEYRTDASSVVVAVVDTGLRTTHEDLAPNLWVNPAEIAGNGVDDDGNGIIDDVHGFDAIHGTGDPVDDVGHGTHVAGIIGAAGNNGTGMTGVAWKVKLMGLKFLDASGEGATSAAIACIDYARTHGAAIINASWGGSARSRSLELAIQRARAAGILLVVAAGNDGVDLAVSPAYPASYTQDNLVVVGATTRADGLASYSNTGAVAVDLAAPGSEIRSAWSTADAAYADASGTSMAAPHVTGTLALLKAYAPGAGYRELITTLLETVDVLPALAGTSVTGGRLNAGAALARWAARYGVPPRMDWGRGEGGGMTLKVSGAAATRYTLESSDDLRTWSVEDVLETDSGGSAARSLPAAVGFQRFYRLVQ